MNFEIDAASINYHLQGSGVGRFVGNVTGLNVLIEGSGDFRGKYLYARKLRQQELNKLRR